MHESAYFKNTLASESVNASQHPIPQSVGEQMLNHMDVLIERERQIYARPQDLLQPVLLPDRPYPEPTAGKDVEEYPPLFTEIRNKFQIMSSSMDAIHALLDRVRV